MKTSKIINLLNEMVNLVLSGEITGDVGPEVRKRMPDCQHVEMFRDALHPMIHYKKKIDVALSNNNYGDIEEYRSKASGLCYQSSISLGNAQRRYAESKQDKDLEITLPGIYNEIYYHKILMEGYGRMIIELDKVIIK